MSYWRSKYFALWKQFTNHCVWKSDKDLLLFITAFLQQHNLKLIYMQFACVLCWFRDIACYTVICKKQGIIFTLHLFSSRWNQPTKDPGVRRISCTVTPLKIFFHDSWNLRINITQEFCIKINNNLYKKLCGLKSMYAPLYITTQCLKLKIAQGHFSIRILHNKLMFKMIKLAIYNSKWSQKAFEHFQRG